MTVFYNNIYRIFKSKLQVLLIVVFPMIILLIVALMATTKPSLKVGIIDDDKTNFTAQLTAMLESQAMVKGVPKDKIQDELSNATVDYIIVIQKNFTKNLLNGDSELIKGYYLKDSAKSLPLQKYLESFITAAEQIAVASDGSQSKFTKGMEAYANSALELDEHVLAEVDRQKSYGTLGIFLLFMLLTTVVFTTLILTDKENKTFYRSITAPITLRSYMLQNALSFLLVSVIQISVVLTVLKVFLGIYLGKSFLEMYLLFLAASVLCVSFGVAVSSKAHSIIQAIFTGLFIAFPLSFLGGCWWNNDTSTGIIKIVGKFTPLYWIMDGVDKLLNEQSFSSIGINFLIVLLFATFLFFFGTWRREDVAE